jgi:hypothetical protein
MYSAKGRTFLAFRYAGMKRPDDHLKLRDAGGHTWPGRLIDDGDRKTILLGLCCSRLSALPSVAMQD